MIVARKKFRAASPEDGENQPKKRYTGFQKLCLAYLFAVFVLPQYFGISLPGFALTAQRIMLVCLFAAIFTNQNRADAFFISNTGSMSGHILIVSPFVFVSLATAILRSDPKSFLNFFADAFLPMILMVYLAANVFTLKEMLKSLKILLLVVCIACYLEALVLHKNPYSFIHTIKSVSGGSEWRGDSYRVAAMTAHPIALGMYLLMMTPLICVDVDRRAVNISKNWVLLLFVGGAMLLTGSRMPLASFALELVILFVLTEKSVKGVMVPYILVCGTLAVLSIILLRNESHVRRYVILNLYQIIDSVFGTNLTLDEFGYWQWTLINWSSDYRDVLPSLLFSGDYDPLLGLGVGTADIFNFTAFVGGKRIASIDNYYVMQYLRFAWPGLITMLLTFAYILIRCVVGTLKRNSEVCKALLVSFALYFVNLWFVADLETFKYAFSLFGLAYVYSKGRGLSQPQPVTGTTVAWPCFVRERNARYRSIDNEEKAGR